MAICVLNGVPAPAMLSGLSWFDSLRSESLPANLLQAQRDYFGAMGMRGLTGKGGDFSYEVDGVTRAEFW